jgi:hypothetical protein
VDARLLPLAPSFGRPPAPRRPLPDAVAQTVAVRGLAVPESAPPYDDEIRAAARPGRVSGPEDRQAPAGPGQPRQPRQPGPAGPAGPERPDRRAEDAAAGWPSRFAQVLAETLAGSRPQRQITPWTTEQARRHIRELGPMLSAGQQPRVRRVVTSCPAADVVEMTAIVAFGPKVRALAVRLERDGPGGVPRQARWLCTAVEAA